MLTMCVKKNCIRSLIKEGNVGFNITEEENEIQASFKGWECNFFSNIFCTRSRRKYFNIRGESSII
jgi:hypothetical protein